MSLRELLGYYETTLSSNYGHSYIVPYTILLASAGRKLPEGRKQQVLELADYAETNYGRTEAMQLIKKRAQAMKEETSSVIDSFLALPAPTPKQIKPYLGKWKGELTVRRGQNMGMEYEITIENGKVVMKMLVPMVSSDKMIPEIFSVSKDGKLIYGRRNRGSGVVISTLILDKSGKLIGEEWLRGFTITEDLPEEVKEQMQFILKNPNLIHMVRQ